MEKSTSLENELTDPTKALPLKEGAGDDNNLLCGGAIKDTDTSFKDELCRIVIFDLETTGRSPVTAELCQIGAYYKGQEFCVYTIPSRGIPEEASAITGLFMAGGKMFLGENLLTTVPILNALQSFLKFLDEIGNVILVAHNGFRYDAPLILRQMEIYGLLNDFRKVVKGFADTLPIFKKRLPDRIKEKKKFNQSTLAEEFLNPSDIEPAHNAVNDVYVLDKLLKQLFVTEDIIKSEAVSFSGFVQHQALLAKKRDNANSLQALGNEITEYMREKIAKADINFEKLKLVFFNSGEAGIKDLLKSVTKTDRILKSIVNSLEKMKPIDPCNSFN